MIRLTSKYYINKNYILAEILASYLYYYFIYHYN